MVFFLCTPPWSWDIVALPEGMARLGMDSKRSSGGLTKYRALHSMVFGLMSTYVQMGRPICWALFLYWLSHTCQGGRGTLVSLLLASGGSLPICLYISQSEYFCLSSRYSGHLSKVAWLPHPLAILIPFLAGSWIFSHAD